MSKSKKIQIKNLTHFYGSTRALRSIDLALEGPGVVGLVGRNGAGKSTLLSILAGLRAPSQGSVVLDGEDVTHKPSTLRAHVGLLAEPPALHDEMSAAQFVEWCAGLRGITRSRRRARALDAMRDCGVLEVASKRIGELSHGYRKRVGIAQAIVHEPALVLLDEPTSGLDPAQVLSMRVLVRALGERALVVVSSHILAEIAQTCDHVVMLEEGRLVLDRAWDPVKLEDGEVELEIVLGQPHEEASRILRDTNLLTGIASVSHSANQARFIAREERPRLARALLDLGATLLTLREVNREAGELEELFVRFASKTGAEATNEEE